MCVRMILKFYKEQMKSENYEICQYLMILFVEAVVKFEWISQFSRTMPTDGNICEEESES